MKKNELDIIRDQIIKGMKISAKKLVESKKLLGQKLIISENGVIRIIDPSDIK
jgi:hypothetical protein